MNEYRFCVAPMMEWTDRHCRVFHRLLTRRALLYTEMVTAQAILHGDARAASRLRSGASSRWRCSSAGASPRRWPKRRAIGEDFGYDEINLNVGCPSDRVQERRFGACLMREPELVADCVAAMKRGGARARSPSSAASGSTIRIRARLCSRSPKKSIAADADALIVHARKAWLKGLSPKENREIPPLDYPLVHALKREYPRIPDHHQWRHRLARGCACAAGLC